MRPFGPTADAVAPRPPWRGLLSGSSVVGIGLAVEVGAQFLRTLILARLLGATEFGLVASVNTLWAVAEMVSFIGVDRYIIYSPHGGERSALAAVHSLSLLRGIVSAVFIFALALPTAALVGARDHATGFSFLAIVPLLRGVSHLGVIQVQRAGRFWPAAAADAFAALAGLIAATTAALLARDFTAVLWSLTTQAVVSVLLSHLLSPGVPYRCSFDSRQFRAALRFGLPLMGNGLALAAAYQLDRMVIGAWLGVVELGIYSLSMALLAQPISLLLRLANTAWQPRLSAAWHQDRSGLFPLLAGRVGRVGAALAATGAVVAACIGSPFLRFAFGDGYAVSDTFFLIMAGVVLARLGRGALNVLGLAIGQTRDLMLSNLVGAVALPVTIAALVVRAGIESAALGGLIGEILSWVTLVLLLRHRCAASSAALVRQFAGAAVIPLLIGMAVLLLNPGLPLRMVAAMAGSLVCLAVPAFTGNRLGVRRLTR
ncbi:oligosaccharide flippase family protein [Rhodopila globiformis]|uniref:Polysaccharide biosynthesis protein C-terminal domain-containing protein n=1 Tax=Rhodopila globiformis TaxID=1071 RepID=A0A2S6MW43_RHOGL|nr:oligosaccharide flippase family protein [Rhodopila globiformis]PPQ26581.1 hypothetical protein CCS01_29955 [Rhodopila globiformis]